MQAVAQLVAQLVVAQAVVAQLVVAQLVAQLVVAQLIVAQLVVAPLVAQAAQVVAHAVAQASRSRQGANALGNSLIQQGCQLSHQEANPSSLHTWTQHACLVQPQLN